MKTLCYSLFVTFMTIAMMSCNDSEKSGCIECDTAPKFKKSDLEFLGCTLPFISQKINDEQDIYEIGLLPYARIFTINAYKLNRSLEIEKPADEKILSESDLYGSKFIELLKQAETENVPVRIYLYPKTNEIWWVEEATEEELKSFEESLIPPVD